MVSLKESFRKDLAQLMVIIFSAIVAYMFFNPNPGESFNLELITSVAISSVLTIVVVLFLSYLFQQKIAKSLYCGVSYPLWHWNIFISLIVTIFFGGLIPFFVAGLFVLDKKLNTPGRALPEPTRVEAAALTGAIITVALIIAMLFVEYETVAYAAAIFAAMNMLPLPKTNGYHYLNWNLLHGAFVGILGMTLLIIYFGLKVNIVLFLVSLIYLPYQWVYVYLLARRTGY